MHVDSFITLKSDIEALWAGAFNRIGNMGRNVFLDMAEEIEATRRLLESLGDEVSIRVNTDGITMALDRIELLHTRIGLLNEERIVLHGVDIQERSQIIGQVLSAAEAEGRFTPQHHAALKTAGVDPVQMLGKITGESAEELTQKMQQGTFTVSMLKQALGNASEEGKRFHEVLGCIKDVSSGVKDGIDGLTKILELTGKFSEAEGSAKLLRTFKNVSGGLDGGLKLVSGAEGIIGGVSKLVGIGEAAGGAALVEGAVATAEAVTGFELLTAATIGATEGLGLIGTALLATPWGAAAAGITAIGAGLYMFYEHQADLKKSGEEWAKQNKIEQQAEAEATRLREIDSHLRIAAKSKEGEYIGLDESDRIILENTYSIISRDKKVAKSGLTMDHFVEMIIADKELARHVFIDGYNKSGHLIFEGVDKANESYERKKQIEKYFSTNTATQSNRIHTNSSNIVTAAGGKQIVIHVKSFAEHFTVNATNLTDAGRQSRDVFERMFLEVLHSANAAM